jgi:endogenous inhibitor of DNA gyrase (YacG/DUF329 family)
MRGPTQVDATLRACAQCGASFYPSKFRPNHQWCSKPCYERGRPKVDRHKHRPVDCPACGKSFDPTYQGSSRWSTHCSKRCAGQTRSIGKASPIPWAQCGGCRRWFIGRRSRSLCSRQCALALKRRLWNEEVERQGKHAEVTVACKQCGDPFTYQRYNGERDLCGKRCADGFYRAADPERFKQQKRNQAKRRRAARRAVPVERFKDVEIYERDRWICQLCFKPTHRRYARSDLMSPTLDHIVPLGLGGAHTRINVQLAHLICNSVKGDRGSSQLRLLD